MADLPSRLDLQAIGRNYIRTRATKIDPAQVDIVGSDVNLFVGSNAVVASELVRQLGFQVAMMLLETSEQEYLDRYSWDRYRQLRKAASPGRGQVQFYRSDVTAGAGTIVTGTKLATKTGIEYITTTNATFSATATTALAYVRSVQAGASQQVGANAIRRIVYPAPFDATIKVVNAEPTAHANDAEADPVFKERIRDFWKAARRGTLSAIAYGARGVAGIVSATAEEALTTSGLPARVVNLYIADDSGIASLAIVQDLQQELMEWRAGGIAVIPYTCMVQMQSIVYRLKFTSGVATAETVENIRSVTVGKVNALGASDTLTRGMLFSILEMFKGAGLLPDQDSIVEPAGDVVPGIGKTIRTDITSVTVL